MSKLNRETFIPKDLVIQEDTIWDGNLQVYGNLILHANLQVRGNLKVKGKILYEDFEDLMNLTVEGNLDTGVESTVKILVVRGNVKCGYLYANNGILIGGIWKQIYLFLEEIYLPKN